MTRAHPALHTKPNSAVSRFHKWAKWLHKPCLLGVCKKEGWKSRRPQNPCCLGDSPEKGGDRKKHYTTYTIPQFMFMGSIPHPLVTPVFPTLCQFMYMGTALHLGTPSCVLHCTKSCSWLVFPNPWSRVCSTWCQFIFMANITHPLVTPVCPT